MSKLSLNVQLPLKHFTLSIEQELLITGITAIFGYSGAGKTTLLRSIAGLEKSTIGQVSFNQNSWLDSKNKINKAPHQRDVGLVFQDHRLFPHLTVKNNLRFAIKHQSNNRFDYQEVLELTNITHLLNQYPEELSGGEQQRVAIARAILNEPELLLLDEPFSALDIKNKADLITLLHRINQTYHLPMLYVSHSLDDIQQLAENMLVIQAGRINSYGPTAQIIHQLNYGDLIHQQTSLTLPIHKTEHQQTKQYGLTALNLSNEQVIYINKSNVQLKRDKKISCYIMADDISICLVSPKQSSIVNTLAGYIENIHLENNQALIKVNCSKQHFFVLISLYSLKCLALENLSKEQKIYIQFKASSVKTLQDKFAD